MALPPNYGQGFLYGAMGLSALTSIGGAISDFKTIQAQGEYEAQIAQTNAAIAKYSATQTLEAGNEASSKYVERGRQVEGSILAGQGGSGVAVGSGSSAIVRAAARNAGIQDALTIRNNAARRAWGYEFQSLEDQQQAKFVKMTAGVKARQTLLSGGLKAVSGPLDIEMTYARWAKSQGMAMKPFDDV